MKRTNPVGRPRKGKNARTLRIIAMVTPAEMKLIRKAAKAAGVTLSDWIMAPRRVELEGPSHG